MESRIYPNRLKEDEVGLIKIPVHSHARRIIIVHQVDIGSYNKMKAGKIIQNYRRDIEDPRGTWIFSRNMSIMWFKYGRATIYKTVNWIKVLLTLKVAPNIREEVNN